VDYLAVAKELGIPCSVLAIVCYFTWHQQTKFFPSMIANFREELKEERKNCRDGYTELATAVMKVDDNQQRRHEAILNALRGSSQFYLPDQPKPGTTHG